jgi:hypothetical protein
MYNRMSSPQMITRCEMRESKGSGSTNRISLKDFLASGQKHTKKSRHHHHEDAVLLAATGGGLHSALGAHAARVLPRPASADRV